jgi:hypothetical protein
LPIARFDKFDDLVKSLKLRFPVIPAKAGIQLSQDVLDPGFRRGDVEETFYEIIKFDGGDIFEVLEITGEVANFKGTPW